MGDTIDRCGGYQTLGARDIALAQWWADRGSGSLPSQDAYRTNWIYIVDQPSSVEAGVNSHGLGEPGTPYEIIVSAGVLNLLIAEMTTEERELFTTDRTWAKYRMRGQVLCRLINSGKLRANGMWLEISQEPHEAVGE